MIGFVGQLVKHRTGIAKVMGSNPVKPQIFYLGFLCNCIRCFTAAMITSMLVCQAALSNTIFRQFAASALDVY